MCVCVCVYVLVTVIYKMAGPYSVILSLSSKFCVIGYIYSVLDTYKLG